MSHSNEDVLMKMDYKQLLAENSTLIMEARITGKDARIYELLAYRALLKDWLIEELEQQLETQKCA